MRNTISEDSVLPHIVTTIQKIMETQTVGHHPTQRGPTMVAKLTNSGIQYGFMFLL